MDSQRCSYFVDRVRLRLRLSISLHAGPVGQCRGVRIWVLRVLIAVAPYCNSSNCYAKDGNRLND